MKEKTKKEICLKIEDFNSVLNENQLEIYKNQVSKLDNKEKIKINSFEYWKTYKSCVDNIIEIINDANEAITILEDQIIRCKSRKENNSRLLTLISLTISVLALLNSLTKKFISFEMIISFLSLIILLLILYKINSEEFLKENYKIYIFKNKIIELKESLTINSKILTK